MTTLKTTLIYMLSFFQSLKSSKENILETPFDIKASRGREENLIRISWKQVKNADSYIVLKSKDYNGRYFPAGKIIKNTEFEDKNVRPGICCWYRVCSVRGWQTGRTGESVQGWPALHMPGGGEAASSLILRLLRSRPHFLRVKKEAKKRIEKLPLPVDAKQNIPSSEDIFQYVKDLCETPHRRIGSPESLRSEYYIKSELEKILGPGNVSMEPVPCDVYNAMEWKLEINENGVPRQYDCFYAVNTGITYENSPKGGTVEGDLIWAGNGKPKDFEKIGDNLSGKIVVARCRFPLFPLGALSKVFNGFYSTSDPDNSFNFRSKRSFTFARSNFPGEYTKTKVSNSVYWQACERGAKGLVLILENHPGKVNTHWGPYDGKMRPLPCLYVDHYMQDDIKKLAKKGLRASITLKGTISPGAGHNICGVLPGNSDESILVSSHHDAPFMGATEDGTGVATVLALAKAWAGVPKEKRGMTIVFVSTTGHFYAGIGAKTFVMKHENNLLKKMEVCINVEHVAARDFKDDGNGKMVSTGMQALNFIFVNEDFNTIATAGRMLQTHKPERTVLVQSSLIGPVPPGEAGHYHMYTGVNFIHWIGQPYYVLTSDDTLDKVDVEKLNPIAGCISDLIGTYMALKQEQDE